jgi:hypothetical protein
MIFLSIVCRGGNLNHRQSKEFLSLSGLEIKFFILDSSISFKLFFLEVQQGSFLINSLEKPWTKLTLFLLDSSTAHPRSDAVISTAVLVVLILLANSVGFNSFPAKNNRIAEKGSNNQSYWFENRTSQAVGNIPGQIWQKSLTALQGSF